MEGSELISKKIRERGWDIFGLNEDFSYHNEIWRYLGGYLSGQYKGMSYFTLNEIFMKLLFKDFLFDTDGLDIGVRNPFSIRTEVISPWNPNAVYGYYTNCQDSLTRKGFRYCQISTDSQSSIDFIILHADAGSSEEDILAREAALEQLYTFITGRIISDNPLVIMGDFNCLYGRDRLKELFIDRLNAVPGLEASDVWVEGLNGGIYPEYSHASVNDDSLNVTSESEMLDKIIYVNRSSAPIRLRLESVSNAIDFVDMGNRPLSDHFPLEASFAIER